MKVLISHPLFFRFLLRKMIETLQTSKREKLDVDREFDVLVKNGFMKWFKGLQMILRITCCWIKDWTDIAK